MSAYRDGTSPGEARSLQVRASPRWLGPLLMLITLLLGDRVVVVSGSLVRGLLAREAARLDAQRIASGA